MPSHGAPITTMAYRSTSGGRQYINTIGIDNIRVIASPVVYKGRVGRVRYILARVVTLGFNPTTGGVGWGGGGKNGEESEEEKDGESRSGDGARHCH